ncbi:amino acid ABC transporter substrate-binding protein [Haematospirillum sp. 15-248]|uniref:amino acid ABC transporter substrate-binding protein n=1 Tax=Haematospirillum sp. 15-248 TaxID=2723107 RepID=UPI00143C54B3|nr:amino acid ABC transporter substrate-binding protein [Haematospirillum sp. 15-248]NKD87542.1 amino acid ABC transporter substrate-binding protein [Haematospirillum sp. 15-248]
MNRILIAVAAAATVSLATTGALAGATLDAVKKRGAVVCGSHTGLAGFSTPNEKGVWTGIDVDVCRAVAAAVFGDATKVSYVPLSAQQRITAVQSGEVDLLARNTTWTLSRDTANGMDFPAVNYYDGQGFMAHKRLGLKSAKELDGATVCVQTGTTTEQNLADYFRANNMKMNPVTIEKYEEVSAAYSSGRCDAITSDISQLAAIRANDVPDPAEHVILPELISKEPLAVSVRHGDNQWTDIVRWSFYAMLNAEELGITSANVDEQLKSATDPNTKRLLGITPGMGAALGLDEKWAYNIIKQVGNYGESFEANVGLKTPMRLERGLNALWNKGGIMYAPPVR